MLWNCLRGNTKVDFNDVVDQDETGNDETLASFDAIDSGIDVDGVCAEDSKHAHINVIEDP